MADRRDAAALSQLDIDNQRIEIVCVDLPDRLLLGLRGARYLEHAGHGEHADHAVAQQA